MNLNIDKVLNNILNLLTLFKFYSKVRGFEGHPSDISELKYW